MADDDFSYEKSVAPHATSYFKKIESNPHLTTASRIRLTDQLVASVEAARTRADEREKISLASEIGRTRLSAERLALEDARLSFQEKRDAAAAAPVFDSEFESILNSADPKAVKAANIGRLGMKHAGAITASPVLSNKFRYAMRAVEPDEQALSPHEQFMEQHTLDADTKSDKRYIFEQRRKMEKEEQDAQEKARERINKQLAVEFKDPDDTEIALAKGGPLPARKFKSPTHRESLLDFVAETSPEELEKADTLNDEELFRKASLLKRQLFTAKPKEDKPAERPYSFK